MLIYCINSFLTIKDVLNLLAYIGDQLCGEITQSPVIIKVWFKTELTAQGTSASGWQ